MRLPRLTALAVTLSLATTSVALANERSEALRREGYDALYNLDHAHAADLFKQAIAADPEDAAAYRAAAVASWLHILFLRGTTMVDDYLGHISSKSDIQMPQPPAAVAAAFHEQVDQAIALGEKAVDRRYNDASSHYALGAGLGLLASYTGTVEGRMFAMLRAARRAFAEHEMAVELDRRRKDAGLVVGTYRYMVSILPAPARLMAYIVGFGGGKDLGIKMIEEAASYPSDGQTDARFALVLLYNRERRYDDALKVIRGLARTYPRNRLLLLEDGATALRAGRPGEAEKVLDEGMARLQSDTRPRIPGEETRWRYKRGMARLQLGKLAQAEEDLRAALAPRDVRGWVAARVHVELGKLADLRGDRAAARREYASALALATSSDDAEADRDARKYQAQPYRQ